VSLMAAVYAGYGIVSDEGRPIVVGPLGTFAFASFGGFLRSSIGADERDRPPAEAHGPTRATRPNLASTRSSGHDPPVDPATR
jgi:hypothetical protein